MTHTKTPEYNHQETTSEMNITDQLNMVTPEEATQVAFSIIDLLQHQQKPGVQAAAAALLFLMLCQRFDERPSEVLNKAARVLYDSYSTEQDREHIYALQEYIRKEL